MGILDHLTCILRNLYAGQEATVTTWHVTMLVQIWKRSVSRLHIVTLLAWLICREHHVKCQAGWSTNWSQDCLESTNNLRYADDSTLMAESEEELKSLMIKVKEESEKAVLKLKIQKTKLMTSSPIPSWQIGNNDNSERLYFLGLHITADDDCSHETERSLLLGRKTMTNLDSILKSRDTTLPANVHLVKAMVFPVVMYRCERFIKKAEHWRTDAFELWCLRRFLRVLLLWGDQISLS